MRLKRWYLKPLLVTLRLCDIPFALENTALLAALTHPNHIVYLCSWGSLACRLLGDSNYVEYGSAIEDLLGEGFYLNN